jgi:hypothetical protein
MAAAQEIEPIFTSETNFRISYGVGWSDEVGF